MTRMAFILDSLDVNWPFGSTYDLTMAIWQHGGMWH